MAVVTQGLRGDLASRRRVSPTGSARWPRPTSRRCSSRAPGSPAGSPGTSPSPRARRPSARTGQSGNPLPPDRRSRVGGAASELRISVTTPTGQRLTRLIAQVPLRGKGSAELNGLLLCPDGCRLDGLRVPQDRPAGQPGQRHAQHHRARHRREVARPRRPQPVEPVRRPADQHQRLAQAGARGGPTPSPSSWTAPGSPSSSRTPTSRPSCPGCSPGRCRPGGTAQGFDAVGINGAPLTVAVQQTVDTLPVLGGQGVLVDYETLARLGGRLPDSGTLSVWVADPAKADAVATEPAGPGRGRAGPAQHGRGQGPPRRVGVGVGSATGRLHRCDGRAAGRAGRPGHDGDRLAGRGPRPRRPAHVGRPAQGAAPVAGARAGRPRPRRHRRRRRSAAP